MLFNTRQPTEVQVAQVRQALESGRLHGIRPATSGGHWTTTVDDVAALMAAAAGSRTAAQASSAGAARGAEPGLGSLYQELLKEYFLAVIMRRSRREGSVNFQRAVVAGQCVLLLTLVAVIVAGLRPRAGEEAPYRAAVEAWLADQPDQTRHQILTWHPADPNDDGAAVRVVYRYYLPGGKAITTDRVFTIAGGRVTRVDSAP